MATEEWVLGGGCFWCLEAVFQQVRGVTAVESGYAGGRVLHPTYEQVCAGRTGHAEVVRVVFDPRVIDRRTLLQIFFTIHDPTTLNRQGNDVGTQYRSAIYWQGEAQRAAAEAAKAEAGGVWDAPAVTEIAALDTFYPAERYHQNYFRNHPEQGYCAVVVAPKVRKFREKFGEWLG